MDAHKLQLKIFLTPDSARAVALEAFVPVFHRWIKERLLPELVIDVASYAHVPQGPGVVLIGHGSDYALDEGEGRRGLVHNRKRAGAAPAARLEDLARRAFHAASLLERDPTLAGKVRFATNEIVLRFNDRLLTPNTDATFAALAPELAAFGRRIFGDTFDLARAGGPKDLFAVRLISGPAAPTLAALLERAGGPPGADASLVA
jgi:hypothetical protein